MGETHSATNRHPQQLMDRIVADPETLAGKPRIQGTRISVELILEMLADGAPVEEILDSYPHISREDILACLRYAAKAVQQPRRRAPRKSAA